MRKLIIILTAVIASISLVSCFDKSKPNYQFMDEMYRDVTYSTYGEYSIFPNEQAAMKPAPNTIHRGWMPYEYENTNDDFARAREELKNPLPVTEANLKQGKAMFDINCAICHGVKGDGQGTLVERGKFLGIPSFADEGRVITEGSIYHVIMYGLNNMGSYASQTSIEERWQIVMHTQNLMAELKGTSPLPLASQVVEEVASVEDDSNTSEE